MILINSAQFVVSDLQAEFGRIPSSFIPLGNKRLIQHQLEILSDAFPDERIVLSLPEDYLIAPSDWKWINHFGVILVKNSRQLGLGQSVLKSLESQDTTNEHLRILHGDTLFFDFPKSDDLITLGVPNSQQDWFFDNQDNDFAWSGFFSFSNIELLKKALTEGSSFEESVLIYDKITALSRIVIYEWLDLGHLSTYYLARTDYLVKRAFNNLSYSNGVLTKKGEYKKINAEIAWYRNIPSQLAILTPRIIGIEQNELESSYSMEYLPFPTLGEIYVYGSTSKEFWLKLFNAFHRYFEIGASTSGTFKESKDFCSIETARLDAFEKHVHNRLHLFETQCDYFEKNIEVSVNKSRPVTTTKIIEVCLNEIRTSPATLGFFHGDFCLGNILFDARSNGIRIIDPRGLDFNGEYSIYGDQTYDLAKLAHSFLGFYDFIISNRYDLEEKIGEKNLTYDLSIDVDDSKLQISDLFFDNFLKGLNIERSCCAFMILLFFTMAPLHSEDAKRQKAFLANGVMLFNRFLGSTN